MILWIQNIYNNL